MNKPEVLILTDWYLPGYKAGGPIKSVANLVDLLHEDISFHIITGDRDLMEDQPYEGIPTETWVERGRAQVMYVSPKLAKAKIAEVVRSKSWAYLYLNSFFSRRFTIEPLLLARKERLLSKVILAPRGMLGEGAMQIKKSKKEAFVLMFKLLSMHRKLKFHATDRSEVKSIQRALGHTVAVSEIVNVPIKLDEFNLKRLNESVRFLFTSRVSPKKNLKWILGLRQRLDDPPQFHIYGEADDLNYLELCKHEVKDDKVQFHGAVSPKEVLNALREHDFFVLPTQNENFGHSIIEALAAGCPVIISDQTPWNDLQAFGAGWVIPLADESGWIECMGKCQKISSEEYNRMSVRAKEYVRQKFDFNEIRNQYLKLFSVKN